METNFEKGLWPELRRMIIVEVKNNSKPASKKRCSPSFINEIF